MVQQKSYWGALGISISTLLSGLRLTLRHLISARHSRQPLPVFDKNYFNQPDGISTIQYPHQVLPVPDNGRYRLHNEIDDCIVCDKCAKICPVNCIEIEPIKATEEIGKTSDGTPKRIYAAKFDIDMAKCCFCGLCTTVCPTECLTMTKVYDFSVGDIREHIFPFAEMSEHEIAEKKKSLEEHQRAKAASPIAPAAASAPPVNPTPGIKPVFKPKIKPGGGAPPAATS
jgi:formate hydrogenlyase subunit 6/NADH:ubiquinone oxidoreductase subunit I